MAYVFGGRRGPAALLLAMALLAGCKPGAEGGYNRVSWRGDPKMPATAFPDPPPVVPGSTAAGGGAQKIVAKNLPSGVTQAMVDAGQTSFGTVCASCHGQNGTGSPAAPKLADNQWIHISGQFPEIVNIINVGVAQPKEHPAPMPPKGGGNFNDEQVRELAAYVYALSHQGGA
ncbi:MAG TPA: cytochrome c [Longimicrobium sp.]|jgi:mono/diheme cytochrome c family protein|uniref:c-type cytochrome n=1 Tax=Longimicrobium sp. TaxID=2029185 RepID=UPI002ED7BFAF